MPARVIEATGNQIAHTLPAHVGKIHWRAGFVLALGHGVLGLDDRAAGPVSAEIALPPDGRKLSGLPPSVSLDHPAIAHKRSLGQVFDPEHVCELFTKKSRFVLLDWSKACAARQLKSLPAVNFSVCASMAYLAFRGDSDHGPGSDLKLAGFPTNPIPPACHTCGVTGGPGSSASFRGRLY
jgi:hypothetical protein